MPWRDVDDSDWCDALVVGRGNDDDGWKEVVDVAPRNRAAAASFMVLLLLHEKRGLARFGESFLWLAELGDRMKMMSLCLKVTHRVYIIWGLFVTQKHLLIK